MKTAIIAFAGSESRLKDSQINAALKESARLGESKAFNIEGYDSFDEGVHYLKENGYDNLVIYHPNNEELKHFEESVHFIYDKHFKNIEVLEESFPRIGNKITEGIEIQGSQSTASLDTNQMSTMAGSTTNLVFVINFPPTKSSLNEFKRVIQIANTKAQAYKNAGKTPTVSYVCIVPKKGEDGQWSPNAPHIASYIKGAPTDLMNMNYSIAATIEGFLRKFLQTKLAKDASSRTGALPSDLVLYTNGLPVDANLFKWNDYKISFKAETKKYTNDTPLSEGKTAFDIYKAFLSSNQISVEDTKVAEFKEKNSKLWQFLISILSDMDWTIKEWKNNVSYTPAEAAELRKQYRARLIKSLGIEQDLTTVNNNARNAGAGLIVDAVVAVADKVKTEKEAKQSTNTNKDNSVFKAFICYEKFEDFLKCFNEEKDIIERQVN